MDEQTKLRIVREKVKEMMPVQPYHNYEHACDVYDVAGKLADMEKVSSGDKYLLKTAALLHDVIMVPGNKDNEEKSAEFAIQYLPELDYSTREIDKTTGLILATKMPTNPSNLLEMIICDSDVDNLGREDCFEKSEYVRQELGIPQERWYPIMLGFLEKHKYYTKSQRSIRNQGLKRNVETLRKIIAEGAY